MLLKKAGMVVLGTAAGVAALSGTAFAGDYQGTSGGDHGHSWDRDHGHHHSHDGGNGNASARTGDCANFGDQLVGLNCIAVQAPINQLGLLSSYDNSSDDNGGGRNGNARTGGDRDGRDGDGGGNGNASARSGDQANFGDQLIGVNNVVAQLPINQLGILSGYNNAS
ncbi:hypothetical protein [Actinomycetospora sp. NBRC 106378]|jgi:hypothetical protein|uniref:hypothetical protein n=1 Tax=Actinomycetospora sp. NBRC 106378 TaxID=3032208 RepID=UPI0024A19DE9|nr:hypothetical protein [Actinomycetospora sp. NBRC 106378]GLZ55180.1 hypothetical protein Acsp07_47970 [Actinomycetospora sp. NBRC 106378]